MNQGNEPKINEAADKQILFTFTFCRHAYIHAANRYLQRVFSEAGTGTAIEMTDTKPGNPARSSQSLVTLLGVHSLFYCCGKTL